MQPIRINTPQAPPSWDNLVATVALRIRQSLDLPTILQTTADQVHHLLQCDRVLLYQFDPDWSGQVIVESISAPRWSLRKRVVHDSCFEASWLEPYQEGRFAAIADVSTANFSSCYFNFLAQFEIKANLVIPVLCETELWGLVVAHHCTAPRLWQTEEINGLQQIAVHVGIAIYQASLLAQLQGAKADLEAQVKDRISELEQTNQKWILDRSKVIEWMADGQPVRVVGTHSDISERKIAELALQQSEEKYRHLLDNLHDGFVVHAPDTSILLCNSHACELLGLTLDQMLGKTAIDPAWHFSREDGTVMPLEEYPVNLVLRTGQPLKNYVLGINRVSQTRAWILVNAFPEFDANRQIQQITIAFIDISDRKQAELDRQKNEATYRALIQAIPDLLIRMRKDGMQLEFINSGAVHFLRPQDSTRDHHVHLNESMPLTIAQERIQLAELAIATGQTQRQEYEFADEGATYYEEALIAPLLNDEVLVVVRDITERRRAAEKLQRLTERLALSLKSGAIGCWDWDITNNTIMWDERMYELYGITKQADSPIVYDIWAKQVHLDDRELIETLLQQAVLGKAEYDTEFRVLHGDGTIHFIKAYGVVVRDSLHNPQSVIGINFDITDAKHREAERKKAELDLKSANRQLSNLVADLNQRHSEMVILSEISDFLQACLTVEEAYNALSSLLEPLFADCAGGIFINSPTHHHVEIKSSWGTLLQSETIFRFKDCWALRRGRIHSVEQHQSGLRCNHIPTDEAIATTLCIPMIAQGETMGLFYLSTYDPTALPEAKQQLARTVAEHLAMAIANLRLQESLKQQSIRDSLTGLFNRRYLEEILNQELSRAQRQQQPLSVLMLDIDHFKNINDTYGHDMGDYVIQAIATLLKNNVRGSDIACRYGGEEMLLILPNLSLEKACNRAEEIRKAITQLSLCHNGQCLGNVTASLGVASFPQHGATGTLIIKAADEALYDAKSGGRNQVMISQ